MSWIHGIACVDTMCEVTLGDERGICDFETTNNALRGSHQPRLAVNAVVEDGFTPLSEAAVPKSPPLRSRGGARRAEGSGAGTSEGKGADLEINPSPFPTCSLPLLSSPAMD
jgi:hypothetical protein